MEFFFGIKFFGLYVIISVVRGKESIRYGYFLNRYYDTNEYPIKWYDNIDALIVDNFDELLK